MNYKFKEGDCVTIISCSQTWSQEKQNCLGRTGKITRVGDLCYGYNYMVEFEGELYTHRHLFYESNLRLTPNFILEMKGSDNMSIKNAKMYVGVQFKGSYTNYSFATDLTLEIGDIVVCDTSVGLSIGKVVTLSNSSDKATKWIIQKVDLTTHKERLAKQEQLNKIRYEMNKRRKEVEELELLRYLATKDTDMAEMLKQYEELMK